MSNDVELSPDVARWPAPWRQDLSISMSPTSMPPTPNLHTPSTSDNDLILPSLTHGQDPIMLNREYSSSIPPISSSAQLPSELELPTYEPLGEMCWSLDVPEALSHSTHFHRPVTPATSTDTRFINAFHEFNTWKYDDSFQPNQGEFAGCHQPTPENPTSSRHDWMHQLSELNMRVHQFMTRSASLEQEINRTDKSIEFPTEFAGKVVELSLAFLRLLEGANDASGGFLSVKPRSLQHSRSSSESGDDDNDDKEDNGQGETYSTIGTDSCNARQRYVPQKSSLLALTEMSTVLQLLAIYLSLQKIHYLLYTAAYYSIVDPQNQESVSENSKPRHQTDPSLGYQVPVFKGLHLGDVSLEQFTTFQVKLVIQVASHLLGEVEHLLGLPDGCRISRGGSDQGKGILGVSASPHLLRMIIRDMRSPLSGLGRGCSPVQATKDRLSQLKRLFRGSVSI